MTAAPRPATTPPPGDDGPARAAPGADGARPAGGADAFRARFSLPDGLHYLNGAYMAPASKRVAAAGRAAIARLEAPTGFGPDDFFEPAARVRRLAARLVHAPDPDRVAIIPAVSYGMATVARNTPLAAGQTVVVVEEQFPSAVYVWRRACRETGATLRTVGRPPAADGRGGEDGQAGAWNAAILDAIDERTAVVVLPELHWTDGTRFDLDAIGARARAAGARLVIDGTQSVGARPFDWTRLRPDALICAGYKWLTGPYGIGVAWYGPAFDDGVPLEENWITRRHSEDFNALVHYRDDYQPGAIRYDVGERSSFILLPMLEAALAQVLDWGPAAVAAHTDALAAAAVPRLRALGCRVADDRWRAGHLFGVRLPPGADLQRLAAELAARQVSVSLRGGAVRVAPHLYNDAADLDALVDAVAAAIDGPPAGREAGNRRAAQTADRVDAAGSQAAAASDGPASPHPRKDAPGMKVIVFGATGRTGQHVWRTAIARGHEVTAFARSPHRIERPPDGLRIARGNVMDPAAVADAAAGHDAAIVVLGSTGLRDRSTLADGTRRIINALQQHGVRRLVVLSAAGVGDSWRQTPWFARLLFLTLLRNLHADHGAQEALVRASPLDWTIVRAAILTDALPAGRCTPGNTGRVGKITRADLAAFLVDQVETATYLREAISVTG